MTFDPIALEHSVRERLDQLTKPRGSLGRLEDLALRFALIRGTAMPSPARKAIYVFCGDHGIAAEGVSAFPPQVTQQMMRNFVAGGAAINVVCRRMEAKAIIVDAGAAGEPIPGAIDRKVARGTRNFLHEPAMTRAEARRAIAAGGEMAEGAAERYDLVGLGEMGIGNTTAAAAMVAAFTGRDPAETVGPGTGHTPEGVRRKADVIRRALELHRPDAADGLAVLAAVGGFELAAITGFLLRASELRLPVVLDGYPCCAGALAARTIRASALDTAFFSHLSAEPGHGLLMEALGARPYFDFGMRLGEGTGAALMMGLIDIAVRLYREMATFDEARVSSGGPPATSS